MAHYMGRLTGPITGKAEAIPSSGFVPGKTKGSLMCVAGVTIYSGISASASAAVLFSVALIFLNHVYLPRHLPRLARPGS
jgi:hypothetical protein